MTGFPYRQLFVGAENGSSRFPPLRIRSIATLHSAHSLDLCFDGLTALLLHGSAEARSQA